MTRAGDTRAQIERTDVRTLPVTRERPAAALLIDAPGGEALVLRPTRMTDVDAILDAFEASQRELRRFMPWSHMKQTTLGQLDRLRQCEADYAAGRELVMALFRREGDKETMLSMIGLHPRVPLNPTGLEVGYWAPTEHAGQGYTTLGVRVITLYAFDKLGAERVQVMCDEINVASRRVIEKAGFVLEGIGSNLVQAPKREWIDGGYEQSGRFPMYALTPESFAGLPWLPELRARVRYVNALGHELS